MRVFKKIFLCFILLSQVSFAQVAERDEEGAILPAQHLVESETVQFFQEAIDIYKSMG